MTDFFDGVFDGYRFRRQVTAIPSEAIFLAERVRDGEEVWVWTPKGADGEAPDFALARVRYEAMGRAARKLGTTSGVLGVRDIIQVGEAPGLVTDVPRGRPLDEILVETVQPRALREVLRWFGRLLTVFESAHNDVVVHGTLTERCIYIDKSGRPVVLGLMDKDEDDPDGRRADVRSLAVLLYHATSGRPPKAGFPYTGQAASPREFIENYPESLARFLVQRLGAGEGDPVTDAGVFRRALEALSVDPDFRKAASIEGGRNDPAPAVIIERRAHQWRPILVTTIAAAIASVAVGAVVYSVMQVRLESAERRAEHAIFPVVASAPSEEPLLMGDRLDAWICIHEHFLPGTDGRLSPEEASACVGRAPGLTVDELRAELLRVASGLEGSMSASDAEVSEDNSYRKLFLLGADEVAAHVRYRLESQLPTRSLDAWLTRHIDEFGGVVQTLARRDDSVAGWAKARLEPKP